MSQRRVLVTGASKGIGQAIAIKLASDGFDVAIHFGNDQQGAQQTLDQIKTAKGCGHLIQFDVSNRTQTRTALDAEFNEFGAFYGVVSNAGISRDGAFPAMSDSDWDDVIHTNLDSVFNVIQPCIMPMVRTKKGGRIVTLSSVSGIMGNRGQVNYSAAKAGIIGATKAMALELGKRNITVNCVAPGLVDTGMVTPEQYDHVKEMIPLRRMGTVKEVADLVGFLMSDSAAYITRQVISVNGGLV